MELPKTGARVLHPLFGTGVVREVSGSGADAKITVDFSPSVGRKKLLAGVAKLSLLDEGAEVENASPKFVAAPGPTTWVEALDARFEAPRGKFISRELPDELRAAVRSHAFWAAVRERLRGRGFAPRVIDDLDNSVSLSVDGQLSVHIRIRHKELLQPPQRVLAEAMLQILRETYLQHLNPAQTETDFGIQLELDEQNLVQLHNEDLGTLPDRDPKRRPMREQPKGVIRNRPRGWNDMR